MTQSWIYHYTFYETHWIWFGYSSYAYVLLQVQFIEKPQYFCTKMWQKFQLFCLIRTDMHLIGKYCIDIKSCKITLIIMCEEEEKPK